MTKRLGFIGFGAISRSLVAAWQQAPVQGYALVSVLVRPHQLSEAQACLGSEVRVTADLEAFIASGLDLAVELAGQPAVEALGARLLRKGISLMTLSAGALAQQKVMDELLVAAAQGGAKVMVPVGAIAGLDGLLAMRRAGLQRVVYASTKPPRAWKATLAERLVDLDNLEQRTVFFQGTAREAASLFPKNANLAAVVALAGVGLDQTQVVLAADPGLQQNMATVEAQGLHSTLKVVVAGNSQPSNPKSSLITGMSVIAALHNSMQPLCFV